MPIPGSGPLFLRATINQEYNGNDTDTNVSLGALSDLAGLDVPPDAMSEFYGTSSFTNPTITAQVSFSSVTESQIRVEFSYSNPNGGTANLESGFYFGTSSNKTSNTFYSEGNSTSTSRSPARVFTGLSGNTTYYCWGRVLDTESPARFTELTTNQNSTATDYDYQFLGVSFQSNFQNINNSDSYYWRSYYQHINGSYTTKTTANSAYNFCNSGTNGVPQLQITQNRNARINLAFTNVANGCTGIGYGSIFNYDGSNYPANSGITLNNFTTLWSTDCRSGYSGTWVLTAGGKACSQTGYKETGHEFGAQFNL